LCEFSFLIGDLIGSPQSEKWEKALALFQNGYLDLSSFAPNLSPFYCLEIETLSSYF
jgi:hypothetical protein